MEHGPTGGSARTTSGPLPPHCSSHRFELAEDLIVQVRRDTETGLNEASEDLPGAVGRDPARACPRQQEPEKPRVCPALRPRGGARGDLVEDEPGPSRGGGE